MLKSCFDLKLIRGEDRKCTYGQGFSVSVVIMNMLLFMAMKAETVDIKMGLSSFLCNSTIFIIVERYIFFTMFIC